MSLHLPFPRLRPSALPRETRDTWFLLAVVALVLAPQAAYLPWWTTTAAAAVLAWRAALAGRGQALPSRWVLAGLLALAVGATWLQFRSVVGREAGVVLVVQLLALKTLELRARRDAMVVFFLGFFILLTLFFHSQSLATALVMGLALWGLLAGLVNAHLPVGRPPLAQSLRTAGLLLLGAAPLAVLLFVVSPRMAPLWGLPQDMARGRSGLSEDMTVGQVASLALDESVALRVRFDSGQPPPQAQLYFRGPVLTDFDGRSWKAAEAWQAWAAPLPPGTPLAGAQGQGPALSYEVTLEPHRQRWLLTLDAALSAPSLPYGQARATPDLQWLAQRPVMDVLRYQATSQPDFRYGQSLRPSERRAMTQLPPGSNPRTAQWAQQLRASHGEDTAALLAAVLQQLRTGGYTYTLEPGIPGAESADDFWFDGKQGFCEHMASALVVLMRHAGVPARVVTGYQGGERNPLDGLWTVRQSDAHAWTEVWLAGSGWTRVDPTAAVAPGRVGQLRRLAPPATAWGGVVDTVVGPNALQQLRAAWEVMNHRWNDWVLNYTAGPQRQMWESFSAWLSRVLGSDAWSWTGLARLLAATSALALLLAALRHGHQRRHQDPWLRLMQRARRRLQALGLDTPASASPQALARAVHTRWGQEASSQAQAVADWLLRMEGLRYRPSTDTRAFAAALQQLRREFQQLRWPAPPHRSALRWAHRPARPSSRPSAP